MKTFKALHLIALLATLLCCTCMAQTVQPVLKLQVISGLPIVNGVFLNGQGPYRFLLDTGEQTNEIDLGLARKLGLRGTFQRELDTPAGASIVQGALVSRVSLGSMEASDQEFLITNREGLHDLSSDVRGTLGQQFLSHFDYTLDMRHHRVTFGDPAPEGSRVDFRLSEGCIVVPTDAGELMLDSGTDTLFFFRVSPRLAAASITTSNASMAVAVERAPALRIGGRQYHPSTAAFHPVPDAPADGLLPASLFDVIFVSNSGHYVIFDPSER